MATDNPPVYLPFGDMAPGLGLLARPGSNYVVIAANVWPQGFEGYLPSGDLAESGFAQTPAGRPTGSTLFDQRWLYYGNTEGEVWEADDAAGSITKRHTLITGGADWSLVRFGDSVVATDYNDPVLAQSTRGSSFSNLITSGPFAPLDNQDESDYSTFAGGTGHAGADVITLSDSTTVTVDTVAAGVVTHFTVSSGSSIGSVAEGSVLTQVSTTGSGVDFSVTIGSGNITGPLLQAKYVATFGARVVLLNLKTIGADVGDVGGAAVPVDAQTETDYSTFAGGTGHAGADVITLSDGTDITVDTVIVGGVVTEFTVDSSASTGSTAGAVLTQVSTTGAGVSFSVTLAGSNIEALHPYSGWVSGVNAANNFDPLDLSRRSSNITMPTRFGEITGAVEVADVLLVFFERGVGRLTIGDGLIGTGSLAFEMIVEGVGTIHSRSIVAYGGAAYFWGPAGPAIVGPNGYSELGADKLSTTLMSGRWPTAVSIELDRTIDEPDIIGCLSPSTNSLIWRYPPTDSAYNDVLLAWNYRTGRLSFPAFFRKTVSIDNTIRLLEDRSDVYAEAWEFGSTIVLGSFDATNVTLKSFSTETQGGENGATAFVGGPRFQMAFTSLIENLDLATTPQNLMLVASPASGSSSAPAISIVLSQKSNPLLGTGDQTTLTVTTADSSVQESGFMSLHSNAGTSQSARYHGFDITITPNNLWRASEIQGIFLRYATGGSW